MDDVERVLPWPPAQLSDRADEPREWLLTNGLGGYAFGSVDGTLGRRYHGILVAALPVPRGRTVMLDRLAETVVLADGRRLALEGRQLPSQPPAEAVDGLCAFRLRLGLPIWQYRVGDLVLERSLTMLHGQNTVLVTWRLAATAGDAALHLEVRPWLHIRAHDGRLDEEAADAFRLTAAPDRWEIDAGGGVAPLLLLLHADAGRFALDDGIRHDVSYAIEAARGYDCRGTLSSPGRLLCRLAAGSEVTLAASTEPAPALATLRPAEAVRGEQDRRRALIERAAPVLRAAPAREWVLAADAFVIRPVRETKPQTATEATETGDGPPRCSIIAGYPWFTDWGRDTMISLEGLCLLTGRHAEAGDILRSFARHVRDGLIPNFFSEHEGAGHYHTADATLWFLHAIDRYVAASQDHGIVAELLPTLRDIIAKHLQGTRFGIGVDPHDGLLRQGYAGSQLTWMDAKVGEWVVTPRRGKAVEINALWYNALLLMQGWLVGQGDAPGAAQMAALAARVRQSFNRRFWYDPGGHLFDVVDGEAGDDASCRPNQLFALSLPHPVLDEARWGAVLAVVEQELLTPVGLRSLSPRHPDYRRRCEGDLLARDAAYHQGTVWAWLIGPFVDAWLRVHPQRRQEARRFLDGLVDHLDAAGVGQVSEIFDAEPPFAPRGCIAQAWSVAEVLRVFRMTAGRE